MNDKITDLFQERALIPIERISLPTTSCSRSKLEVSKVIDKMNNAIVFDMSKNQQEEEPAKAEPTESKEAKGEAPAQRVGEETKEEDKAATGAQAKDGPAENKEEKQQPDDKTNEEKADAKEDEKEEIKEEASEPTSAIKKQRLIRKMITVASSNNEQADGKEQQDAKDETKEGEGGDRGIPKEGEGQILEGEEGC